MNIGPIGFLSLVGLVLAIRLLLDCLDRARLKTYIENEGGRLLSVRWSPFGSGWIGEKSDRLYQVIYLDSQDRAHTATCKTSLLTGVYFTLDRVLPMSSGSGSGDWMKEAVARRVVAEKNLNYPDQP